MADDNFQSTQVPGGVLHYVDAAREVGVAGAPTEQTWDLTVFSEEVRKDPVFRDQLIAQFQALDSGVTLINSEQILPVDTDEVPTQLRVEITAAAVANRVNLSLVLPHSAIR